MFHSGLVYESTVVYDSSANKSVVAYRSSSTDSGKIRVGTVSGTSISFDSETEFESNTPNELSGVYDPSEEKKLFLLIEMQVTQVMVLQLFFVTLVLLTNITSENYIGISRSGAASGAGAIIDTQGAIADNLSGLTAGQSYFVQNDGTLGTTAADPSVFAGTAVSATKLIVKGLNMLKRIGAEESGEFKAVASGTLPSGKPVVVNADGTVSVVVETSSSESLGSDVTFNAASTSWVANAFDSTNNKVVVAYSDGGNSSYGHARVGTVDSSDNSISFGTEVTFRSSASQYISACFDSANGKIVIAYQDQGDSFKGKAIIGTVSGTDISFGSSVEFQTGETTYINAVYDTSTSKVVIVYRNSSGTGKAIVGTVKRYKYFLWICSKYRTWCSSRNGCLSRSSIKNCCSRKSRQLHC